LREPVRHVLNVGGNNRKIPLPPEYTGWEQVVLDVDPRGEPDLVWDARELSRLSPRLYDAVYCSHNLEHYYRHEVPRVLSGFLHVLKPGGFAHIRVPDLGELMRTVVGKDLDIDDFLYDSPAGPIAVRDVIYGYGVEIEKSGNDFYAHKTGFTVKSLTAALLGNGFAHAYTHARDLEIVAVAFAGEPDEYAQRLWGLQGPEH
jgi:hypothetical protein